MITKKIAGIIYGNGFMLQDKEGEIYIIESLGNNDCFEAHNSHGLYALPWRKAGTDYHILARPLSDLTKEIIHNGETFVPIDIFGIGDDGVQAMEFDYGNIKLTGALKSIAKNNNGFDLYYLPHAAVEELIKLNFAVCLPEGSWIPVTEQNNPYK